MIFIIFVRINIQSRFINIIAKGCLAVYLLHDLFITRIGIEQAVSGGFFQMIIHIVLWCIVIFLSCGLVGMIYEYIVAVIRKRFLFRQYYLGADEH